MFNRVHYRIVLSAIQKNVINLMFHCKRICAVIRIKILLWFMRTSLGNIKYLQLFFCTEYKSFCTKFTISFILKGHWTLLKYRLSSDNVPKRKSFIWMIEWFSGFLHRWMTKQFSLMEEHGNGKVTIYICTACLYASIINIKKKKRKLLSSVM